MLAKMWKKILLAVCIIACLFNLTSKLVNRHSLESNLKSADDGSTVLDAIKTEKAENENESTIIDNENNSETKSSKKTENTFTQNSKNTTVIDEEENEIDTEPENRVIEENQEDEGKKTYKYTDFVVTF